MRHATLLTVFLTLFCIPLDLLPYLYFDQIHKVECFTRALSLSTVISVAITTADVTTPEDSFNSRVQRKSWLTEPIACLLSSTQTLAQCKLHLSIHTFTQLSVF